MQVTTLILIFIALLSSVAAMFCYRKWLSQRRQLSQLETHLVSMMGKDTSDDSCFDNDESLKKIVLAFRNLKNSLADSSISSIDVAMSSAKVSNFITNLNDNITEQHVKTRRVSEAAEELSRNSDEIVTAAKHTSDISNNTQKISQEGLEKVLNITGGILSLNTTVDDSSNSMREVNERVQDVLGLTSFIDSVADKTNLLALNAAIEAARAGEHGRGFAVVAEEVRDLASKTSAHTAEIGQKLDLMDKIASKAVEDIINFQQMVSIVVQQVEGIGNLLKEISQAVNNTDQQIELISSIMEAHHRVVKEISSSSLELGNSFDQVIEHANLVSNDAISLSNQAEKIYEVSSDYEFGTLHDKLRKVVIDAANKVAVLFEDAIKSGQLSETDLFDKDYQLIPNTNPQKFTTRYDSFTDKTLPSIQEPILDIDSKIVLAGAVDINGYFPTHNQRYSKALTGNYETDLANNRTKRIFDDRTGSRCGANTKPFLLQTYIRDTGEVMHDISAPIYVNGKHWGGFRIGYTSE
jgi:methyl-accepting chemotaxis protein